MSPAVATFLAILPFAACGLSVVAVVVADVRAARRMRAATAETRNETARFARVVAPSITTPRPRAPLKLPGRRVA